MVAKVRAKHGLAHSVDAVSRRLWVYHAALGDDLAKAVISHWNGHLIGASVLCRWHDRLYVTDFGRDERDTQDPFVYFNATIYEPVEYAYAGELSTVVTGAGSELGKARRGAALLPLTHLAIAAGDRTSLGKADPARAAGVADHWRDERSAHPRYFGSAWDELL
jgi:hypothetical protein